MSDILIKVEGLGKRYLIRHQSSGNRYKTIREGVADNLRNVSRFVKNVVENSSDTSSPDKESFWALEDINFEVRRGEALGILGRNGAGKSTLLKTLSRITEPTTGSINIYGRIASLLEVGTGFHPELTGRENIFLNGAVLGMSRVEIRRKFDEIVDFAGVEKFLDTPVKRYSSGMYVRLAFAVAAHLEPEILIVDEVLAVGDAEFQKKCLGKLGNIIKNEGRTVLFVSHNMASLISLCGTGMLLEKGKIIYAGEINDTVNHYLKARTLLRGETFEDRKDRQGNQSFKFMKSFIRQTGKDSVNQVEPGQDVELVVICSNRSGFPAESDKLRLDVRINDILETKITWMSTEVRPFQSTLIESGGTFRFFLRIKNFNLRPGQFNVTLFMVFKGEVCDWIINAFDFEVNEIDFYGNGRTMPAYQGLVLFDYDFTIDV